ncbi:hypothetical protein [Sulfurospirillum multivorans]|uniref:Membrane protein n=2 Tax=Sulfurospirillum multivorans TaxID=66821 RepID=A0AA86ANG8_SULMK|nr:hypothetical protein [Sulfurospirillum multivorans]AHJ12977.1 putative membrane protein [Sulfurospirillum multivorans DSM 12446]QEH06467.1 putative membrane protein [Sulfurospirillum multivorans]
MRHKRVQFLRHFNDFRMLSMFTIDVVGITLFVFVAFYSVLTFGGIPILLLMPSSMAVTWVVVYVYVKAKKNSSKGYLRHWLFNKGLYQLHHDEEKWPELKHADTKNYLPHGSDKFFAD